MSSGQANCDDWVSQVCGVDPRSYDDEAPGQGASAAVDSLPGRPMIGPLDDGASPRSRLHAFWQAGFDEGAGKTGPNRPQGPSIEEQSYAYDAGVAAGRRSTPSPQGPQVCEAGEDPDGPAPESEPNQCEADPAPGPVAPEPPPAAKDDDGSDPASPLHNAWQQGYDDGHAAPDDDHPAPTPYAAAAARAYEAGFEKGKADAAPPEPEPGPATTLNPSPVGPQEEPATYDVGGVPAFRYNLPAIPIGSAEVPTPGGLLILSLSVRGAVTVTFPNAPPGVSTGLGEQDWRVEAARAVGPVTSGIRVNGLGGKELSIGGTMGVKYAVMETRFTPPGTMSYIGQARYEYDVPSKRVGAISVRGQAGFELRVTIIPDVPPPEPVKVEEPSGVWEKLVGVVGVVGVGVVVIVAIAGAPESDGASLLLLKTI